VPPDAALPLWLPVGLVGVAACTLYGFVVTSDGGTWGVTATALATVLLTAYTARLYTTALAQLRASTRPLLTEVKPYAPPPPDLGAKADPQTKRPLYNIEFPDGFTQLWDGRRIFVYQSGEEPFRVSLILRNVGPGLALISNDVQLMTAAEHESPKALRISELKIRYPRLPPGESTRINIVAEPWQVTEKTPFSMHITYADFSQQFIERAIISIASEPSEAWTRDLSDNLTWGVRDISYHRR
jgi:hypothetical protein